MRRILQLVSLLVFACSAQPAFAQKPGDVWRFPFRDVRIDSVAGGRVHYTVLLSELTPSTVGKGYSADTASFRTVFVLKQAVTPPTPPPVTPPVQPPTPPPSSGGWVTLIDSGGDDKYFGKGNPPSSAIWDVGPLSFKAGYISDVKVVDDPFATSGKAINYNFPTGTGAGFKGLFSIAQSAREFSVHMRAMYSPNWQLLPDKWFYFGSVARNGSMYFGISPSGTLQFHVQNGVPNAADPVVGPDGNAIYRSKVGITFGTYHTLDVHCAAQSAPGVADGYCEASLDGQAVTDWQFLKGSDPRNNTVVHLNKLNLFAAGTSAKFVSYGGFQCCFYWGGSGTKTQNDYIHLAELVVKVR